MLITMAVYMMEEILEAEVRCVVVIVRARRDIKRCSRDIVVLVDERKNAVSDDELCDDELDDDKSWEKEEGRLLVSLYSTAGRPWP